MAASHAPADRVVLIRRPTVPGRWLRCSRVRAWNPCPRHRSNPCCLQCGRRSPPTEVRPCSSRRPAPARRRWCPSPCSTSRGPAGGRIVVLEPRRLATRAAARRMASLLGEDVGGIVGYRTRDERRVGTADTHRGRDRGDPHPPAPARSGAARRRAGRVRRGARAEPADRSRPGVRPRRAAHDPRPTFASWRCRRRSTPVGWPHCSARRCRRRRCARDRGRRAGRTPSMCGGSRSEPNEPARAGHLDGDRRPPSGARRATCSSSSPGAGEIRRVAQLLETAGVRRAQASTSARCSACCRRGGTGRRACYRALPVGAGSCSPPTSPRRASRSRACGSSSTAASLAPPGSTSRTGLTRLQTVSISKASAEQRAGRAGRIAPGVVYRLWSKGEHAHAADRTRPRDPPGRSGRLRARARRLGHSRRRLLGVPRSAACRATLADGRELLAALAAVDGETNSRITPLGRRMNDAAAAPTARSDGRGLGRFRRQGRRRPRLRAGRAARGARRAARPTG